MCVKCPDGSPSCGSSSVSCQTGYFYDAGAQCKRNDTYFAMMQTTTSTILTATAYVTMMFSIFVTAPFHKHFQILAVVSL